ncbi:Transcriptional regulatory protein LiaR [Austwickia sp. TVS 96-490-7B]|uniref:response regulator n=1 Tax=Austwickia sp. TVS 96-490-7B TaxID=2830843 RepID=UPI001DBD4B15|nr:response regulator transcription factor [Austwickia sp. TVS 96-490-7B]MBW3085332.1 Transcriptional regulatory protein LiaR [Austwickia sp. TVS 96-490-7B]
MPTSDTLTRVVIVDDDSLVVEALRLFVESAQDLAVVGTASDGLGATKLVAEVKPDVVLMDMHMPYMDGVEATKRIHESHPDVCLLTLSSFATDRYVVAALRAGASGYLVKDTRPEEIIAAIRRAVAGEQTLSPEVVRHVVSAIREETRPTPPPAARFITEREMDVIKLLTRGMSNKEIAENLFLTEATVKSHLARLIAKLGVRDRVQAVIRAYEWNIADLGLDDCTRSGRAFSATRDVTRGCHRAGRR